jgi:hypothetical protein
MIITSFRLATPGECRCLFALLYQQGGEAEAEGNADEKSQDEPHAQLRLPRRLEAAKS